MNDKLTDMRISIPASEYFEMERNIPIKRSGLFFMRYMMAEGFVDPELQGAEHDEDESTETGEQ
jgi:hypothetical protein